VANLTTVDYTSKWIPRPWRFSFEIVGSTRILGGSAGMRVSCQLDAGRINPESRTTRPEQLPGRSGGEGIHLMQPRSTSTERHSTV
jgi:hypothetical protein